MAQFVHQYVSRLVEGQAAAANMLNVNLYGITREQWVMLLTIDTAIGVVMKTISEVAPQVTDAVWLDRLSRALDESAQAPWPPALLNQVNPNEPPPVG
jgi:hypothetical protein